MEGSAKLCFELEGGTPAGSGKQRANDVVFQRFVESFLLWKNNHLGLNVHHEAPLEDTALLISFMLLDQNLFSPHDEL